MRKLENDVRKYGPEAGRALYHALQSHAAHAGVGARFRRKLEGLSPRRPLEGVDVPTLATPLFPELDDRDV